MTAGSVEQTSVEAALAAFGRHGDRVAVTHAAGEWTYRDLLGRIHRMARALRERGLRRGDVLALLTGNRPETFVLRYAANVLGCCTTVLYAGQAKPVLAEMVRATDATALVLGAGEDAGPAPGVRVLTLDELARQAAAAAPGPVAVAAEPDDLASIRLTGGSTGVPKGIPHDFRVPGYLTPAALEPWWDSTQLLCTEIGHLGGTLAEVVLAAGGRVVLRERFDAGDALAAIERERVSFAWLLPGLLHQLLDHPSLATTDTSSLRGLLVGGWASTPHRIEAAIERFGPIVAVGYGTFEAGQITILGAEESTRPELRGTVGRPVPGVRVSVRDDAGEPVDTGVTGRIWVRGPGVMAGYYRRPEETAAVLRDGWFDTGDLGVLDAGGYLSIVGRSKDVINAEAGKVHPARVEEALLRHPAVHAAAVFGVTLGDNDERVCAAVVPARQARLTEADVLGQVRELLGAAYVPEKVLVLAELPVTGSQKPDRAALRRMAAGLA